MHYFHYTIRFTTSPWPVSHHFRHHYTKVTTQITIFMKYIESISVIIIELLLLLWTEII